MDWRKTENSLQGYIFRNAVNVIPSELVLERIMPG